MDSIVSRDALFYKKKNGDARKGMVRVRSRATRVVVRSLGSRLSARSVLSGFYSPPQSDRLRSFLIVICPSSKREGLVDFSSGSYKEGSINYCYLLHLYTRLFYTLYSCQIFKNTIEIVLCTLNWIKICISISCLLFFSRLGFLSS